jgi:predicted RNA-binding Zn ribbon-like protein
MKPAEREPGFVFDLTGGRLCLDFANTVSGSRGRDPVERLKSYADLVSWGQQTGIVSPPRARHLLEENASHPKRGALIVARARALREVIYRIWVAQTRGERPADEDLTLLNSALAEALPHQRILRQGDRFTLTWADEDALESVLWPVVKSAVDLLTGGEAQRVRQCEAFSTTECNWLFIDETKNRSRRWCSMADCGNRAKARRHYHRKRQNRDLPTDRG